MKVNKAQDEAERTARLSGLPDRLFVHDGLEVRKIGLSDADDLYNLIVNNPEIPQRVAWASRAKAPEDVIPSLRRYSDNTMNGRFVIVGEGKIVGYLGMHPTEREGEYGMGYCLDKAARGNGYVTKALIAVIEQLKLIDAQEIYLQIVPGNDDSIAVAKRLGCRLAESVTGVDFPVEQQRWRLALGV